ncbi:MAG: phosphate uptake regulator PhoU [Thermosphaera sp.]
MPSIERRKVQKTGSSSFIITLPKEWVDAVKLKSGDHVYVYEYEGKLVIIPPEMEMLQTQSNIKVSSDLSTEQVFRMLVAAYLSGYTNITITFDPSLSNLAKRVSDIKNLARVKLAGVEVVEESYNTVTFKILLNIKELPIVSALRRLHLIVNNMLNDVVEALTSNNRNLAEAVIQRDDEADRFHHMIVRELSMALIDVRIQHELGLSNIIEAMNYRIIARNLERIADHATNIAKRLMKIDNISNVELVITLAQRALEIFNKSMDALYSQSRREAEEVIQGAKDTVNEIDRVLYQKLIPAKIDDREKAFLVMVCDSLRRIVRYSNGIAEASLNIKASKSAEIEVK